MNIAQVGQQLSELLNKASSLFLAAGDDFGRNLQIGQIIKGKVLRSYDSGRYLVDFSGKDKIVDSSVPLKSGELIQGRVVGVGDKVELKRIPLTTNISPEAVRADVTSNTLLGNKWDALLRDMSAKFQVRLTPQDKGIILDLIKRSSNPAQMMLNVISLLKQGLPVSQQAAQLLEEMQSKNKSLALYSGSQDIPEVAVASAHEDQSQSTQLQAFASVLVTMLHDQERIVTEQKALFADNKNLNITIADNSGEQFLTDDQAFSQHWCLVNHQVDGSIQHRVTSFPLWLGDRLIEINLAIYEQHAHGNNRESIKYKRLVFTLDLEYLGKLSIEVKTENKNIRLHIASDNEEASDVLLSHASALKSELSNYGWALDEISYKTFKQNEMSGIINTVVQHYVTQDSLNKVM